MRLLTIILILLSVKVYSQPDKRLKGRPKTLEECYTHLDNIFDESSKYTFKIFPENIAVNRLHHGFGTWIRNSWGLWGNSKLKKYFVKLGIFHPDNMSGIILTSYHRHLNDKDIRLNDQINYYNIFNDSLARRNQMEKMMKDMEVEVENVKNLFTKGDTIMIGIYAPEKRLSMTYATSVMAYAIINDIENLRAEIVKIENVKRRTPINKVGDIVDVNLLSVNLIPPKTQ